MSSEPAIRVEGLGKCYHIYERPQDRLKQALVTRLARPFQALSPHLAAMARRSYFREFCSLTDVSFQVAKGEIVGVIGRNGSGKSTLLQIIAGTLAPSSGSVEVNGRLAALLELGAGFNPEFTGRENVYLNAAILGLGRDELETRLADILAFADIGDFIDQPVKTYSSGMFVRLAFAVQANIDPEVLIVDEALAVGDAFFVHRCMARLRQLVERGTTVLFVSHDSSAIKRLCNRAIWIEKGRIAADGPPESVVDGYLAALFEIQRAERSAARAHGTARPQAADSHEHAIANIDERLGDGALEIIGVQLYDAQRRPTGSAGWGDRLLLRVSYVNRGLAPGHPFSVGYIVRDFRGIDLASTNTDWEGLNLQAEEPGVPVTAEFSIELPCLHPGAYSVSPGLAYPEASGRNVIADRIVNALVFSVENCGKIATPLKFRTEVRLAH